MWFAVPPLIRTRVFEPKVRAQIDDARSDIVKSLDLLCGYAMGEGQKNEIALCK